MDHAAVPPRLMLGDTALFFEHRNLGLGVGLRQFVGDGAADDASADHNKIKLLHGHQK
jgi:hypothetical protein